MVQTRRFQNFSPLAVELLARICRRKKRCVDAVTNRGSPALARSAFIEAAIVAKVLAVTAAVGTNELSLARQLFGMRRTSRKLFFGMRPVGSLDRRCRKGSHK